MIPTDPEKLLLLIALLGIAVLIPTVGMYNRSREVDRAYWQLWTGGMFIVSIALPVVGPIVFWLLYTSYETTTVHSQT